MHSPSIFFQSAYLLICSAMLIPHDCLALLITHNQTPAPSPSSHPHPHPHPPTHTYSSPSSIEIDPTISASSLLHPPTVSGSSKFNPSMAIIIFVVIVAFILIGILSMYTRRCTTNDQLRRRSINSNLHVQSAVRRHLQSLENGGPPHGLDLLLVSSLPTMKFSTAKGVDQSSLAEKGERIVVECVVCLSEFEDGEELRSLPKCGHCFHLDCINMWLFSHTTCPLCRRSLLCEGKHNEDLNTDVHEPLSLLSLQ